MKKTINVAIGGCSFTIDEDAYGRLEDYLEDFKGALDGGSSIDDVMGELEDRIADLLKSRLAGREVVDLKIVNEIIEQVGYPQGYKAQAEPKYEERPVRKLFRDPDNKRIAGVCSGVALFLGVDTTLIRVIFLIAFICGSAGFWIYLVIWIAAPEARTAAEKCELRGIPANAENIRRFTQKA